MKIDLNYDQLSKEHVAMNIKTKEIIALEVTDEKVYDIKGNKEIWLKGFE